MYIPLPSFSSTPQNYARYALSMDLNQVHGYATGATGATVFIPAIDSSHSVTSVCQVGLK